MPASPIVSVITPTRGGPIPPADLRALGRCLASVHTQIYPYWEHLIVSVGAVHPAVRGATESRSFDLRVRLLEYPTACAVGAARSFAAGQATGRYLAFLDDDNFLFPDYLDEAVLALRRSGRRWAIVGCLHFGPLGPGEGVPPAYRLGEPRQDRIDTIQIVVDRDLYRESGGFAEPYLGEDGRLAERLATLAAPCRVPRCLAVHL